MLCGCLGAGGCGLAAADSFEAAVGGALGGGLGAYVGNELGGDGGAVIGGALGAVAGAAVATQNDADHRDRAAPRYPQAFPGKSKGRSARGCPPGLAKQWRCW
ncbi:MAG: hypothetical protein GVY09_00140 [Gammaproteobacteria bacterium]|jgi:uncharacterized membrane protein|nr:hypothetical protein [Gammaproteobacteria bacterium]